MKCVHVNNRSISTMLILWTTLFPWILLHTSGLNRNNYRDVNARPTRWYHRKLAYTSTRPRSCHCAVYFLYQSRKMQSTHVCFPPCISNLFFMPAYILSLVHAVYASSHVWRLSLGPLSTGVFCVGFHRWFSVFLTVLLVSFFLLLSLSQLHPGARYESITPRTAKRNAFVLCIATRFVNSALRRYKTKVCAPGTADMEQSIRISWLFSRNKCHSCRPTRSS